MPSDPTILLIALGKVALAAKRWQERLYDERETEYERALDIALADPTVMLYLNEVCRKETSHA